MKFLTVKNSHPKEDSHVDTLGAKDHLSTMASQEGLMNWHMILQYKLKMKQHYYSPPHPTTPSECKPVDDVFNYNCALLTDGFLFFNFLDAIKEGDGLRIMNEAEQVYYAVLQIRWDP